MVNRILMRKLFRDIWSRKLAFIALIAIVGTGIAVFVAMASVYLDLDAARARYYREYQLADFFVTLKRAPEWTPESVRAIPNVKTTRGRIRLNVLLELPHVSEPITGLALSLPVRREPSLNRILLKNGTYFSSDRAREAILDYQFAKARGLKPGDRIKAVLLDKQHDLLVVGTAMSPEFVYLLPPGGGLAPDPAKYGVMYVPRRFLQEAGDLQGAYNELIGTAFDSSRTALDNTLDLIKRKLDRYGVYNPVQARDRASVSVVRDELAGLQSFASFLPVLFLAVAALVLNVLLGRIVRQQRGVIGTFRALGYSTNSLTLHFLAYGFIVAILGSVFGLLLGSRLQYMMLDMYRVFFAIPDIRGHIHPFVFLVGPAAAILAALLGTFGSSRRAARLEPAEAMKPPPPEKGNRVILERLPFLWEALSFRSKLVLRGIFRNPFRSSVVVFAAAVATSLVVAAVSMMDSLEYLMNYHFREIAHEDLAVDFRDPVGTAVGEEIAHLPGVSGVEERLSVLCDLRFGPFEKRTVVMGLTKNPQLYTPLDVTGRPLTIPPAGVILTRKLAEILNVSRGDVIRLRPLVGVRREVEAPVVGVTKTFLGLSAYCSIDYLSRLIGEYRAANGVLVTTLAGARLDPILEQLRRRPSVIGYSERERSLRKLDETMGQFLGAFITIMVVFALVIGFGSIINTALVSLSERRRDIGTFRVIGYTSSQVAGIFSGESFLLNGIGILIGLKLGMVLSELLSRMYDTEYYRFPAYLEDYRLIEIALFMLVFVGISQVAIFRMIKKSDWLEVLKIKE